MKRSPFLLLILAAGCSFRDLDGLQAGEDRGATSTSVDATSVASTSDAAAGGAGGGDGGAAGDGGAGGEGGDGRGGAGGAGAGGEGGSCTPPAYADVVLASQPLAYFRLEETEGSDVASEVGPYTGRYRETTTAPGLGGPIELGQPGLISEGFAVGLPPSLGGAAGGLALDVDPEALMGNNQLVHDFSIELWFQAASTFRGPFLWQETAANDIDGLRLIVSPPEGPLPEATITAAIDPDGTGGESVSGVATTGLDRLHIVLVAVTRTDPGCELADLTLYLNGASAGTIDGICAPGPTGDFVGSMILPGTPGTNAPFTVDEIALYDRALTAEEVAAHRRAGLGECD